MEGGRRNDKSRAGTSTGLRLPTHNQAQHHIRDPANVPVITFNSGSNDVHKHHSQSLFHGINSAKGESNSHTEGFIIFERISIK